MINARMTDIVEEVCKQHRVRRNEFYGPRRTRHLVLARWEAVYRMRQIVDKAGRPVFTFGRIAQHLRRDPSTIRHALTQYRNHLAEPNRLQ